MKRKHTRKPDPQDKEYLKLAARAVDARLPDNHGFILLALPFNSQEGRIAYISTLHREEAIAVMKEFLLSCSAAEDWMKHL